MAVSYPMIMGVLNVTPDSFSDGGQHWTPDAAIKQAQYMLSSGADIIDIGGESTRPGAQMVSLDEELSRVIPVIDALRKMSNASISIDTSKPQVMEKAINSGANLINDVNALQADGALAVVASSGAKLCLMHRQGSPKTMQNNPTYNDVVDDIKDFFSKRISACVSAGISEENIMIDPGFGFGKTHQHNLEILSRLAEFKRFGLPILVGVSRKQMIGDLLNGREVDNRVIGSVTAAIIAVQNGANIVRVHDVLPTKDALTILQKVTKECK